jgi:DNA polymerase-3 subunit beta
MSFQLIVSSRALLAAAKLALPLVAANPVVPILENLLLTVADGQLTLRASNLNTTFTTAPLAVEAAGSGSICVPAKLFTQTLAALPDQPITLVVDTNTYAVELRAARSKYRQAGENSVDFPRPGQSAYQTSGGEVRICKLLASTWADGLAVTLPFVSTDINRPSLTGVAIQAEADGALRLVATDGYRVQMFRYAVPEDSEELSLPAAAAGTTYVLPADAAGLLQGLLREKAQQGAIVRAVLTPDYCQLELPAGQLHCRLIDQRFPEWQTVVPMRQDYELHCDRDEFVAAIGRAALYANEKSKQVRLLLGLGGSTDEFTLAAENLDFSNEGSETISAHYEGEAMQIGFSAPYLTQSLKVLPAGAVVLSFSSANQATLMRSSDEPNTMQARVRCMLMSMHLHHSVAA